MKKMSVLTVLVMLVTLTAYSVSGTYAKYTSKIDMTDEARVAKWELLLEYIGVVCRSGKSQMDRRWAGAVVLQSLLYLPLNFLRHILLKLWILYPILYM